MRQLNFSLLTLLMLSAVNVACSKKQASTQGVERDVVELTASIDFENTGIKSTVALNKSQEDAVNNYQVFIFDAGGALDIAGYSSGSDAIKLKCSIGSKKIYAIVNHPSNLTNSTIKKESELLALKSDLSDNSASGGFVMYGALQTSVTASANVQIPVDRLCSKVYIDKITNKLSGAYGKITIYGIYVTNIAGDCVFGNESYCPTANGKWYNKMAYASAGDSVNALIADTAMSATVQKAGTYSTPHYFYCYPNSSNSTASAGDWSPRCCRLVIETAIEGDNQARRYYVLNLLDDKGIGIGRNKYYHIRELTVLRPGSTNPDTPVSTSDVSFSIKVNDWNKGLDVEEVQF